MKKREKVKWAVLIAAVLTAAGSCGSFLFAQRNLDVAEANVRAAEDTVRTVRADNQTARSGLVAQHTIALGNVQELLRLNREELTSTSLALEDRDADHIVAVNAMEFSFDSIALENVELNADLMTLSRSDESFRVVALDIVGPPISGDVDISIPSDTSKSVDIEFVRLKIEPFRAIYTIACAGHDAVVVAETPEWVNMELQPGAVDPNVCNPLPVSLGAFDFKPDLGMGLGAAGGFVLGWFLGSNSASSDVTVNLPSEGFQRQRRDVSLLTIRF